MYIENKNNPSYWGTTEDGTNTSWDGSYTGLNGYNETQILHAVIMIFKCRVSFRMAFPNCFCVNFWLQEVYWNLCVTPHSNLRWRWRLSLTNYLRPHAFRQDNTSAVLLFTLTNWGGRIWKYSATKSTKKGITKWSTYHTQLTSS